MYPTSNQGASRPRIYKKPAYDGKTVYRLIVKSADEESIHVAAIGFISDGSEVEVTLPADWPDKYGFSLA